MSDGRDVLAQPTMLPELPDSGEDVQAEHVVPGEGMDRVGGSAAEASLREPAMDPLVVLSPVQVGVVEEPVGLALGPDGRVGEGEVIAEIRQVLGQREQRHHHHPPSPPGGLGEGRQSGRRDQCDEGQAHQDETEADLRGEEQRENTRGRR